MDLDQKLTGLIVVSASGSVRSRENSQLEYKQSFNLGAAASYMKSMAAFANAGGGFIVFGISDSPRMLRGVNKDKFDAIDPVRITALLNSALSPEIHWDLGSIEINGIELGYIYTHVCRLKPVIATANRDKIQEGQVYYRYRGQSRAASYSELHQIIQDRLELERKAWREITAKIANAGPLSVGILDKPSGRLFGGSGSYLITSELASQLTFVKEGSFKEYGDPTLKLVGEVQPVDSVQPVESVPLAIHFDEIVNSFLGQSSLSVDVAKTYLEQSFREDSFYQPFHFFRSKAGLDKNAAVELLRGQHVADKKKENIEKLLLAEEEVSPVGQVRDPLPEIEVYAELESKYDQASTHIDKRSLLTRALSENTSSVLENIEMFEAGRILEAVSHLSSQVIQTNTNDLLNLLSYVFLEQFYDQASPVQTSFRKAIARIDQSLFSESAGSSMEVE